MQDTLNIVQRDASRQDSRAMPPTLYKATEPDEPEPYATTDTPAPAQDLGPASGPPAPPVKLPRYKEWTASFKVTQTMIDVLLAERPLRRKAIIERLEKSGLNDPPAYDFANLVSHYLRKDPRFVRCYENGFWTLADWAVAMGPVESVEQMET